MEITHSTGRKLLSVCLLAMLAWLPACQQHNGAPASGAKASDSIDVSADDSARILMDRVDHYYKNVMHDSLYALAPQAMDYNREHQQWREYYTTWCLLVNDLVWNGQMDRGLAEAQRMHKDAIARDNDFGVAEAYIAMGVAYHFQGNDSEATRCYEQALARYPKDADQSVKQNIYSYFCQVLVEQNDNAATDALLAQWKNFLDEQTGGDTENAKYAHWMYRYHRECYKYRYAQGQYEQAAKHLDLMQHYLENEDDRQIYEAQVAGFRMQLAMANRDYASAMSYSDVEIALSRQQDFNTFLNALKHRSDMLQQLGHYEEALLAWRSYDQQKDSIIKADTRQQLNELNKRFEVDELKAQQERNQLEHERSQLRLVLLAAAFLVVLLMAFIVYRQWAVRRLRTAYRQLEDSNNRLSAMNEELTVANARAEESSRMKTDFIQQISHEIRTPLNILCGFAQIVIDNGQQLGDEERTDISQRIEESASRITGLVNKMLELSDASSHTVIDRTDSSSVMQIALQAIEESGIGGATAITFNMQLPTEADIAIANTNQQYAARALAILLDNAQKFTPQGNVLLKAYGEGGEAHFAVEDTGIGIPPEEAEHIFDEFVQLDEFYDGTGIGLTIARSIARRLGGDVVLDTTYQPSAEGTSGARFVLNLPLQ